jgi:hypothetical protein
MSGMNLSGINTHGSIGITQQIPQKYNTSTLLGVNIDMNTKEGKAFMETLRQTEGMNTAYNTIMSQESKANGGDGVFNVRTLDARNGLDIVFGKSAGLKGLNIIAANPNSQTDSSFEFQFIKQEGSMTATTHTEASPSRPDQKSVENAVGNIVPKRTK